jgi:hypothetical protein
MQLYHCVWFQVTQLGYLGAAYFAGDLVLGEIILLLVTGGFCSGLI